MFLSQYWVIPILLVEKNAFIFRLFFFFLLFGKNHIRFFLSRQKRT